MPLELALPLVVVSTLLHFRVLYPRYVSVSPNEYPWQVIGWFVAILLNFAVAMAIFVASVF